MDAVGPAMRVHIRWRPRSAQRAVDGARVDEPPLPREEQEVVRRSEGERLDGLALRRGRRGVRCVTGAEQALHEVRELRAGVAGLSQGVGCGETSGGRQGREPGACGQEHRVHTPPERLKRPVEAVEGEVFEGVVEVRRAAGEFLLFGHGASPSSERSMPPIIRQRAASASCKD